MATGLNMVFKPKRGHMEDFLKIVEETGEQRNVTNWLERQFGSLRGMGVRGCILSEAKDIKN